MDTTSLIKMMDGIYQSHKTVTAAPMTRQDYNDYRGWKLPDDEDGADVGFLVEYLDGGVPNDMRHAGYISWTPQKQFLDGYSTVGLYKCFGEVITGMHSGKRYARVGWNGKNMFIFLVPGSQFKVNRPPLLGIFPEGTVIDYRRHIDMRTADGDIVVWTAAQSDILANDWVEVEV